MQAAKMEGWLGQTECDDGIRCEFNFSQYFFRSLWSWNELSEEAGILQERFHRRSRRQSCLRLWREFVQVGIRVRNVSLEYQIAISTESWLLSETTWWNASECWSRITNTCGQVSTEYSKSSASWRLDTNWWQQYYVFFIKQVFD